ncbi:MAG: hypothetical protein JNL62_05145 [Bryobacterales bacterium]|nr:hypothetical protein [Bryobacterales bacterium]
MQKLAFAALAMAATLSGQDYFPLEAGNQWIYRVGGALSGVLTPNTFVAEISGTRNIDGREYFQLTGLPGGARLLRKNEAGTLVFYSEQDRAEHNWVAFQAYPGEAFRTEIDDCNPTAVIQSKNAELRSPLGEFRDGALRVGYAPGRCADAGLISETFLPYVGLAQRRMSNIAGEVIWDLIYARLGGFTAFSEAERSFQAALNASRFAPNDPITVRMTLRNTTGTPLELTFPSGQDFDVVIRNEKGDEVYRWSNGRGFTLAIRMLRFSGEKNYAVAVRPNLPAGTYTLTASLAVSGTKLEATLPLEIR